MRKRASVNKLSFLEQYYSQTHIEKILGVSPRYQRLIKEGKRSGAKYADAIDSLFDLVRKSPAPPQKRRRPPRKRAVAGWVFVPDMLNVLFSIFEPRTFKPPKISYQNKETLFLWPGPSWPMGKWFDTWFMFYIAFGVIPEGDQQIKRYRRVLVPDEDADADEDEDEGMEERDREPDSIEYFLEILAGLSHRERSLIEHLGLEEKILAVAGEIPSDRPVFVNFWMTRVSTAPDQPQSVYASLVKLCEQSVEMANEKAEGAMLFTFIGMYGFYGFNV